MAKETTYDAERNGSNSELESFLDSEPHAERVPANARHWVWDVILLLIASGWLIPVFAPSLHPSPSSSPVEGRLWQRPHKTPLPPQVFERVSKTFVPDDRYIGPSNATHHNWDHLVAAHDALYIPDAEKYDLPKGTYPPFEHPNKVGNGPPAFYVVTILHELHCLNIIRFHYWQVKGVTPASPGYSEASWDVHMDHCFEYLRQAISCGSSFGIEGASPLEDPENHGHLASTVTGWGLEHTCINIEALRAFQINQEKVYNSTWQ
ncbi:hypothetical protein LX32DRAFT_685016 [Colletotrichum zoysiae]|uniref:Tat pathway signal sequence n=1 Tax=Colletotrichum zoysiae TaxID=1216348 RepID=A0AAD9HBF2_9PEZI|nr:hypothetical protein LX32DRAFT_685016 [Colletotrichum zoysiae]